MADSFPAVSGSLQFLRTLRGSEVYSFAGWDEAPIDPWPAVPTEVRQPVPEPADEAPVVQKSWGTIKTLFR